jgi:phosphoribosyl 1,2-cyclic phosphate phosphodiesterase
MAEMAIEFLGTAGAFRTPRPGCRCRLCTTARRVGIPWERTGPSVFVHGPDVLIDTPEESALQVDRAGITHIAAGLYSHWHPDHTAGRRMYETRNWDWYHWPPQHECTPIYLPPQVANDFETKLGLAENFRYLEGRGLVEVRLMDAPLELNGWRISAHPVAEPYVYAFLFEELDGDRRRALIAMDELVGWTPPDDFTGVELAVLPTGIFEFHPLTGARLVPEHHPVLKTEATFRQTLAMAEKLQPDRLLFAHIEEAFDLSPEDFILVADKLRRERGWNVTFAYDTLMVQF